MHYKLIVFGLVLVVVVIFGFAFWDDFKFNQQEISNIPLPPDPILEVTRGASGAVLDQDPNAAPLTTSNDFDSLEKDLNSTSFEIDSDSAQLESEASAL